VATTHTLTGTTGNDTLASPGSKVTLVQGLAGKDTISLNHASDEVVAGDGDDSVTMHTGAIVSNTVDLGAGNDTISIAATTLNLASIGGAEGDDSIRAAAAFTGVNATIQGGAGNDTVNFQGAGTLTSVLVGTGNGTDKISGSTFTSSTVIGGAGADTVALATLNSSSLYGGKGADSVTVTTITGGKVFLGAGKDTITVTNSDSGKVIGGAGVDKLTFNGRGGTVVGGGLGDSILISTAFAGKVYGDGDGVTTSGSGTGGRADGADRITGSSLSAAPSIYGGGGADTIRVGAITKTAAEGLFIDGGDAADSIVIGAVSATTTISGGKGADTVTFTSVNDRSLRINADGGHDRVTGAEIHGSIYGGAGNDTIIVTDVSGGSTLIDGGAGNDTVKIVTSLRSGSTINGGAGNDTVYLAGAIGANAAAHSRKIDLGDGDDSIRLDSGAVIALTAGALADVLTVTGGAGTDTIHFGLTLSSTDSTVGITGADTDAHLVVTYNAGDVISGFTGTSFSSANFKANNQISVLTNATINGKSATYIALTAGSVFVYGDNTNGSEHTHFFIKDENTSLFHVIVDGKDLVTSTATGNVAQGSSNFGFSIANFSGTSGISITLT